MRVLRRPRFREACVNRLTERLRGVRHHLARFETKPLLIDRIVNQHLQAWKAGGWTDTGRGNITLFNVKALEAIAHES